MSLIDPHVAKVEESDIEDIMSIINYAFPYTSFTYDAIKEKIASKKFYLLKAHQNNILVGFLELEFFIEKDEARLNAIFIQENWRGQRFADKLVDAALHECRRRRIKRLFLLVKTDNDGAKGLYQKHEFVPEGLHNKEIDGSKVEVWAREI